MLDINVTLFIQIANFLVLLFFLNILLFRPIRKVLAQRDEETEGLQKMIEDYQGKAEGTQQGIEEGMVLVRKEGFTEKEGLKGQGLEGEKEILQGANSSAEEKIGLAKKDIEAKMDQARKALEEQIAAFSRELSEKILGRSIQ